MSIVKEERHKIELDIFNQRSEGGVRAVHRLLLLRQGELNAQWPTLTDEDLTRAQGEARHIAKLIKSIEQGPTIKEVSNG